MLGSSCSSMVSCGLVQGFRARAEASVDGYVVRSGASGDGEVLDGVGTGASKPSTPITAALNPRMLMCLRLRDRLCLRDGQR